MITTVVGCLSNDSLPLRDHVLMCEQGISEMGHDHALIVH